MLDIKSKRDGTKVWTPVFRGGFVTLETPRGIKGDAESTKKYSITMLFKSGENLVLMEEAVKEAATNKWGESAAKVLKNPKFKMPFKKQEEQVNSEGEVYAGMTEGGKSVNASSINPVGVVDAQGHEIIDWATIYSGAWYRATVKAYAWDHPTGGKGVSFGLHNVQFLKDDDALGGGKSDASSDFEAVEVTSDDSSSDDLFD